MDKIFDLRLANKHSQTLQSSVIFEEVLNVFNGRRKSFAVSKYVEAQVYEDFHAFDDERWLMNDFHVADPEL